MRGVTSYAMQPENLGKKGPKLKRKKCGVNHAKGGGSNDGGGTSSKRTTRSVDTVSSR